MSKSNDFENLFLRMVFLNENIPNVGDATGLRGSTTPGSLYLSLHTSDPGEAGTQATNEIAYTNYAREALPRDATAFTVTGNQLALAANVEFPIGGVGASPIATHIGIGVASAGATTLLWKGALSRNVPCGDGIIPRITTDSLLTED